MANELSFPGGFTDQKVKFAVGNSDSYSNHVTNGQIDDNQFYVIKQGTQYFLYLGKNPISASAPVYDSSLSLTSTNAVQNKVVTQALNNAVEVIKDENIETYQGGKFYYKADNLNPSLKFYISSLESIDLLKTASVISTYSATDETNAISGKGVAEALKTLKLFDVENTLPESLENGSFYRVYNVEKKTYDLWFITAAGAKINLTDPVPVDHSDESNKYGASAANKYGHAKSGIVVADKATTLSNAYSESDLDADLVGSNTDAFARVDHKHPYPNFYKVANTATEDEKKKIAEMLLGSSDTYSFIQSGNEGYKKNKEDKIIPANERLFTLENDYISSTTTTAQAIASKLTVNDDFIINSSKKLIAKTIESPKTTGTAYDGLTFNGSVFMTNGLSVTDGLTITSGDITANSSAINASSASFSGALTAKGTTSLGTDGKGLKITNPDNSSEKGVASSSYDWTFTGDITAASISATSINASLTGSVNSNSATFTGTITSKAYTIAEESSSYKWNTLLTLNFGSSDNYYLDTNGSGKLNDLIASSISTSTFTFNNKSLTAIAGDWTGSDASSRYRLVYDSVNVLTEQDLNDSNGLVLKWLNSKSYATQSAVKNISDRIVSTWDTTDTTKLPTEAAITGYLSGNYVATTRVSSTLTNDNKIPTGSAVTAGIQKILATTISNSNSTAATPGAVQTYISGLTATSISNSNNTFATPGAVQTYVSGLMTTSLTNDNSKIPTSGAVYNYVTTMVTVSNTQPTGSAYKGQLWINTSIGNGVLYYYTGSTWQVTSGVWS